MLRLCAGAFAPRRGYDGIMSQFSNTARPKRTTPQFRVAPDRPMALLGQCPAYQATPLRDMAPLAGELGLAALLAKDETGRMRLGSFKALGGVFAVAQIICDAAGTADPDSPAARNIAAGLTFVTASAGNHGLAVASGARIFGARAVIVLDATVPDAFVARIRAAGAEVRRAPGVYEDAVALATRLAKDKGWLLLADGSWPGYTARPALVMEGYGVLAQECLVALAARGDWPTHVFLQAGVGGMAAAVAAHLRSTWPRQPCIVVVEPDRAPCLRDSVRAGRLTRSEGAVSNMGRLDCKDASLIAFEALRGDADVFVTISDAEATAAVDMLARHGIATTPSGAAGLAGLRQMAPGPDARCLIVATERAT